MRHVNGLRVEAERLGAQSRDGDEAFAAVDFQQNVFSLLRGHFVLLQDSGSVSARRRTMP